eukprot:754261-Hanusia_phi.AAC.3
MGVKAGGFRLLDPLLGMTSEIFLEGVMSPFLSAFSSLRDNSPSNFFAFACRLVTPQSSSASPSLPSHCLP